MRRWVTIGYLLPAVAGRHLFVVGCLGCEARIAEPGADGENAPAIDILNERQLAQSLHHGVIVHQHGQLVVSYVGNAVLDPISQQKMAALPVSRQILAAALDRAILPGRTRVTSSDCCSTPPPRTASGS